jgi:hypothetical protein
MSKFKMPKIQQKAKIGIIPLLLVISLSLVFYFLLPKIEKLKYQHPKIPQQIGTTTQIMQENKWSPPAPPPPGASQETEGEKRKREEIETKKKEFLKTKAKGNFYFEKTKEIKFKDYGNERIKTIDVIHFESVNLISEPSKVSQYEIPDEILNFPKELLLSVLNNKNFKNSKVEIKESEEIRSEEFKNLLEKLKKFNDKEYKKWLLDTMKSNEIGKSLVMIDYFKGKDFEGNNLIILRIVLDRSLKDPDIQQFSIDIFLYSSKTKRWIKIEPSILARQDACGSGVYDPIFFTLNDKFTIFSLEYNACGWSLRGLSLLNIGYVFYNSGLIPVFYNLEDSYIIPLSQLSPFHFSDFPKFEDLAGFEGFSGDSANILAKFPYIARIYKDKINDYLLISNNSELWLVIYNRKNGTIEEKRFIKKLNIPSFRYIFFEGGRRCGFGPCNFSSKMPILVDIDKDGINEILIPNENPIFVSRGGLIKNIDCRNCSKPVKIEFLKFIPEERKFEIINDQQICKISEKYLEQVSNKNEELKIFRASLFPLKILDISPLSTALNTLIYNVCFDNSYKFSFIFPEVVKIINNDPHLDEVFKLGNYYMFIYHTIQGAYHGADALWFVAAYDNNKNKVYTYLLDALSEEEFDIKAPFGIYLTNAVLLDKDKIKIELELPSLFYENYKREYTIEIGKISKQIPLISSSP